MANDSNPRQTKRIEFQRILERTPGVKKVYFQQPPTMKMEYPCIVYHVTDMGWKKADNQLYLGGTWYTVTHIHRDPDDEGELYLLNLQYSSYDRHFTSDNLHHDVYKIFYI